MKKLYLFLFVFMSCTAFAQAPLATEDFNYTAGDALTAHGWAAHSGGTTNPVSVTSPGLTFTGYVGSGIGLAAGVNNTGQDVNKLFTAQTTPVSVYTSFMVNATLNTGFGGYFFHYFDPTANTAFRARTFIKPVTGKMQIGFSFNASLAQDSLPNALLNFGETYLFVVKYTVVDGATNDIVSLYVFKAGDNFATEPAKPTIGPLTATRTTPTDPLSALGPDIIPTGIALRQFEAAQRITVDGFRVKTKWQLNADDAAGINQIARDDLKFYPNPVTEGYLNLVGSSNTAKQVEIFDVVGKKVFNANTSINRLDVRNLNSGVYLIKVTNDNVTATSRLVIK